MELHTDSPRTERAVTLEDVVITDELRLRPSRPPNFKAEANALRLLAQSMAQEPEGVLRHLVELAVELCGAGTAGISLLEPLPSGEQVFRWVAMSGILAAQVGNSSPRDFSACGLCLKRGAPQLFRLPGRYFDYLEQTNTNIVEGLVLPFYVGGEPLGTIWVLAHDEERAFDQEDARLLASLANFTASAFQLIRSHERLRFLATILENVRDSVIVSDLSGRVLHWNAGSQAMFGYSAEEMMGQSLSILYPEGASGELAAALEQIRQGVDFIGEWQGRRKDGSAVWIDAWTRLMRDDTGRPIGLIGVSKDATERKRAQAQLLSAFENEQRAHALAERARRAREEMMAIVSHDLRNPLSAIMLTATTIRRRMVERGEEGEIAQAVDRIARATESMSRLIHDLLDLSRIEAGTIPNQLASYETGTILHEAVEQLETLAAAHGQRLEAATLVNDVRVKCDAERILQVFSNLVGNAVVHAPAGSVISLGGRAFLGFVEFWVHNEGEGIPHEAQPHLFDRYWQAKRRGAGVGLGLSIVKGIVQAHGGSVRVESEPGQGATFYFSLPIAVGS